MADDRPEGGKVGILCGLFLNLPYPRGACVEVQVKSCTETSRPWMVSAVQGFRRERASVNGISLPGHI